MSDSSGSNRRRSRGRRSKNHAGPGEDSGAQASTAPRPAVLGEVVHLTTLRDRIVEAVGEIQRLRAENQALRARLEEMETQQATRGLDALFGDEEAPDPERLKGKLDRFIAAIDAYLGTYPVDDEGEETEAAAPVFGDDAS
ncbi:MAG: hypothetical protein AAF970_12290 [Bacteroidota bacterium]